MPHFAETDRLIFRPYKDSDKSRLFELMDDVRIRKGEPYPLAPNHPSFAERIPDMIKGAKIWVIIESKQPPSPSKGLHTSSDPSPDDRFVGQVLLQGGIEKNRNASLGIAIEPRWWGQGIGTEATRWIVDFGFEEFGLHRIGLDCISNNERAIGAYKKAGFLEEGRSRESVWMNNGWHDNVRMGLLRSEWEEAREGSRQKVN